MTVKEFIQSSVPGITIPEAFFAEHDFDFDQDYEPGLAVGDVMISILEGVILAPRVKSVNENGFSMTWDTDSLGKYYLWLCKKYGKTPDPDVIGLLGMNSVIDISDCW